MLRLSLILLFSFFQNTTNNWLEEVFTYNQQPNLVYTDNLNNFYAVNNNQLRKYDEKGELLFEYSNKNLGDIHSVDVSSPLRPLVFFKAQNTVVLLDNTLTDNRTPINLQDKNIFMAALFTGSVQNNYWIYDAQNFELLRLDESFSIQNRSGNLIQLLGSAINPNFMTEANNKLYVNDPSTGIMVFDIFGTYIKTVPIYSLKKFKVYENQLIYMQNNKICIFNMLTHGEEKRELPVDSIMSFDSNNQQIIFSYPNNFSTYRFINP